MDEKPQPLNGICHCGAVRFSVHLNGPLQDALRCNCSCCRMRGAVIVFTDLAQLKITTGEDLLTCYQFHTKTAKHYFCSVCGIYTHHQRRFDPTLYAVNVACLEGISPFDFAAVPVVDGTNHPKDTGGSTMQVIGTLRFEPLR